MRIATLVEVGREIPAAAVPPAGGTEAVAYPNLPA
jgi:hypothetical protein